MIKRLGIIIVICLFVLLGILLVGQTFTPAITESGPPTLEQVRELGQLVTLRLPISQIRSESLRGYLGGHTLTLAAHGDVLIGTDLEQVQFEQIDHGNKTLVLILPKPKALYARLDHERTRIVELNRHGLWVIAFGDAGGRVLTNRAMRNAQRQLDKIGSDRNLIGRAQLRAEQILLGLFIRTGWKVTVRWLS